MKKFWLFSIGILPLFLLASCGGAPEETAETPASPAPTTGQAPPSAAPPANAPLPPTTETPDQTILSSAQIQSAGLIPSTNPQERLKDIKKTRNNPFELMPVPVIKFQESTSVAGNNGNNSIRAGAPGIGAKQISQVTPQNSRKGNFCSGQSPDKAVYQFTPGYVDIQPEDAQGVYVSGILNFYQSPVAIVKARGEAIEQSVTEGTYFSKGLVRVKNIDSVNEVVTLEQGGQVVTRRVGEQPIVQSSQASSAQREQLKPQGPDGFGIIRGVMLEKISIDFYSASSEGSTEESRSPRLYGVLCNDSSKDIKINSLSVQVQDRKTNNVIDSFSSTINRQASALLPGQRIEFDVSLPKLRGRKREDLYIRFMDWR